MRVGSAKMKYSSFLRVGLLLATTTMSGSAYADGNWTGFYLGASSSYTSLDAVTTDTGNLPTDPKLDGALLGIQSGYNMQMDNIVLGFESNTALSTAHGNGFWNPPGGLPFKLDMNYLSTVRGRMGMAFGENDSTLLFIAGGLAMGNFERSQGGNKATRTHFGVVVGGGLEHMLTDSISIKAEANYIALGKKQYSAGEFVKFHGLTAGVAMDFHF
jgi:outer membrane immunogenic protein